jgi:D-alanyl-D-alanine carboxypeptidase
MLLWTFKNQYDVQQLRFWLLGTLLSLSVTPLAAQQYGSPLQYGSPFYQPEVAARSAVLMNAATGEIIFAKEPHLRLPPASTTKVLTALLVMEHLNLDSQVQVSPQAASAPPSRIGLRAGEAVSAHDLLYGLLLKSGNDAAEALAEAAGGSIYGFANLMNAKAWEIGARESHFMNPHGLPNEDHYTTAHDLALIFRHAMQNPSFADVVRTRNAALRIDSGRAGWYGDGRLISVHNTNRLLESYAGTLGGKTGFTLKARRCFVGEVDRGGTRLIVSILNSPNSGTLWQDARTLLDYGFARSGLTPPPPMQPQTEPRPVWVRNTPDMMPTAEHLTAMSSQVDEDEDFTPVNYRNLPSTPPTATRAIAQRPATSTSKPIQRPVAQAVVDIHQDNFESVAEQDLTPRSTDTGSITVHREPTFTSHRRSSLEWTPKTQASISEVEHEELRPAARIPTARSAPSEGVAIVQRTSTPPTPQHQVIRRVVTDDRLESASPPISATQPVLDRPAVRPTFERRPAKPEMDRPVLRSVADRSAVRLAIGRPAPSTRPEIKTYEKSAKPTTVSNKPLIVVKSAAPLDKPALAKTMVAREQDTKASRRPLKAAPMAANQSVTTPKGAKTAKPESQINTVAGKAEKQAVSRVLARAEPPSAKLPQKGVKPRI